MTTDVGIAIRRPDQRGSRPSQTCSHSRWRTSHGTAGCPSVLLDTSCALERLGDERNARIFRDIRTYHIDPVELAELSADAAVGTLMLTHQVPSLPDAQALQLFGSQIATAFDGDVVVANDGSRVTVDRQVQPQHLGSGADTRIWTECLLIAKRHEERRAYGATRRAL